MSKGYNPDQLWFTADTHFFHKRVLEFGLPTRKFGSVEEMNEHLIHRWNEKVRPGDTVVVAGDFSFGSVEKTVKVLQRLNGQKLLAVGNHDHGLIKNQKFLDEFVRASPILELRVQDPDAHAGVQRIVVCHYAMRVWNQSHRGAWHVYGHSHGGLEEDGSRSFDVGVESGVYPWSYHDVKEKMSTKTFTPVDHHK